MDAEALAEKQADVADALKTAEAIVAALRNAESCETAVDYFANLAEAGDDLATLEEQIKELIA